MIMRLCLVHPASSGTCMYIAKYACIRTDFHPSVDQRPGPIYTLTLISLPPRRAYSACLKESKADSNYHYPRPHRNQRVSERPEIYIDGKQLRIRNGSGRVHGPGNGVLRGKATCGNVGMLHIWWTDAEALVSDAWEYPRYVRGRPRRDGRWSGL